MGFLDYAWDASFQKDKLKIKILLRPKLLQPLLLSESAGHVVVLPEPLVSAEEKPYYFLGYEFAPETSGKLQIARLLKACVYHLTAHVMTTNGQPDTMKSQNDTADYIEKFSASLIQDIKANTYMSTWYPDKLSDIAYANCLAFQRMKSYEEIRTPATRIMTALLSQINIGMIKGTPKNEEMETIKKLSDQLSKFKEKILATSTTFAGEQINTAEEENKLKETINCTLENYGPFIEAPSLPHTEQIGPCTIFQRFKVTSVIDEKIYQKSLATLGGNLSDQSSDSSWKKEREVEALQVFDDWINTRAKEKKILANYENSISLTRFKSICFPEQDYTEYFRTRANIGGASRRLLDSLRVAADALDEDPRKEYGILDLQDIIQVVASKNPRTDVFMRDEYLSRSYAWSILLDTSRSMTSVSEDMRVLALCLVEAVKELLVDATSWGLYAFNDNFYIVKDPTETYSARTRARIGGLKFEGLSYMPDALRLVGEILKRRTEELKIIIVLSDGWLCGYQNIDVSLTETVDSLEKKGFIVIGVGVKSTRMQDIFRTSCSVNSPVEMIKQFSNIYVDAIRTATSG